MIVPRHGNWSPTKTNNAGSVEGRWKGYCVGCRHPRRSIYFAVDSLRVLGRHGGRPLSSDAERIHTSLVGDLGRSSRMLSSADHDPQIRARSNSGYARIRQLADVIGGERSESDR